MNSMQRMPITNAVPSSSREELARIGEAAAKADAESIAAILDVIRAGERFLICAHARPDGDSVGSMLALRMMLHQMGKTADVVTADRIAAPYSRLPGASDIQLLRHIDRPYDAVFILECDSVQRTALRGLESYRLVNIDHHITGGEFAHINWVDSAAASVGEMVWRLACAASVALDADMATCLYITILTDTGGFCYGSVHASTFALAEELVEHGADPVAIAHSVYFSHPVSKLALLGAALRNLTQEGRLAWLWVTEHDLAQSRASEEDCESIVNVALGIAGIEAAVFLRELPGGNIRISLRSKGALNVAAVAACLGGGGHGNAAGCTLEGPLERALHQILQEMQAALAAAS